jgi:serine/threonine-protein kinase
MALAAGTRLGHYEILSALGAGGMGEVYRARDVRLNRDVAIKVLQPTVAGDPDRLARFRREAQLLAALNHPHIAQLYGIEDEGGQHALVMELVEGPTLADRIELGRLPLGEALPIAAQIADALACAHDQRIVHRDLKPSNIKVRADGTVKVLDFGLAKALEAGVEDEAAARERAALPTITAANTMPGVVLGTAAYMPPEQIKGQPVDKRADLWAFGCVLFEMLSGRRAFDGPSSPEVLARVIEREPDWTALPADTPGSIHTLLRRCLAKDPRRRLDSAAAVRLEVEDAIAAPRSPQPPGQSIGGRRAAMTLAVVAALAAAAGVGGTWMLMRPAAAPPLAVSRFAISLPASQALAYSINDSDLALSADGRQIVFTAGPRSQLHVRALEQLDAVPFAGAINARAPFMSRDGRWIGFFDRFDEGVTTGPVAQRSAMRKVSTSGGPPIVIAQVVGASRGAVWGPDDAIVFATSDTSTGIMRVAAGGGEPEVLTRPDPASGELDHYHPSLLPGGRGVLFTVVETAEEGLGRRTAVLDQRSGQQRTVLRSASQAQYVPSGHLVYVTAGNLWAVRFDVEALAVVGDPVPLVQQVLTLGASAFAISSSGTLVFVPDRSELLRTFVWVSRDGTMEPIPAPPRRYVRARLSPDGTRMVAQIRDDRHDLWVWDFRRERSWRRLTFDPDGSFSAIWTKDGRDVIYGSPRPATDISNLYRRAADGTGAAAQLTTTTDRQQRANTLTVEGTRLIFEQQTPQRDYDLMMMSLADPSRIEPLLQTPFDERDAEISPNGRWMAYDSNESGQLQLYVRPFRNVAAAQYQVSIDGGRSPVWSPRGDELFFVSGTSLMRAAVDTAGEAFKSGSPERLFDAPNLALDGRLGSGGTLRTYDVSPDGQRFLAIRLGDDADARGAPAPSFIVVENWLEELRAKFAGTAPRR